MQEGIGRTGFRLLASVFFGIGVLGLATTFYAFNQAKHDAGIYDWLGFALTGVAIVAVYVLVFVVLAGKSVATTFTRTSPEPQPNVAVVSMKPALPEAAPDNNPNIEFDDAVPAMDADPTGPSTVVAAGRDAPQRRAPERRDIEPLPRQAPVLPPNRNLGRDTHGWPERKGPSGITRRQMMEQMRAGTSLVSVDEEAEEAAPAPTNPSPRMPSFTPNGAAATRAPTILAKPATGEARPGTTKGKCGGCGALLLAPAQRPVNLKCPRCDKVTLLS